MSARDEVAVEVLNGGEKNAGNRQENTKSSSCCSSETFTYLNVAMFAIFGCLIRIGLDTLVGADLANIESSDSVVFKSFFSNMLGSFILGVLSASTLKSVPGMAPVYTGISTGLCGSITTYSKWNQQVSMLMIGEVDSDGHEQIVALSAIALGLAASLCSFEVGKDVTTGIRKKLGSNSNSDAANVGSRRRQSGFARCFNSLVPIVLLVSWVTLLVLSIVYSTNQTVLIVCLCGVFAPFGATFRYILGKLNASPMKCLSSSSCLKLIPVGTFLANFIGATLIACCHVVLTWAALSCVGIASLKAIQSGFLACLTTVSTFMSEISGLRGKGEILASHCYAFLTILLCQLIGALINGTSYRIVLNTLHDKGNLTCP